MGPGLVPIITAPQVPAGDRLSPPRTLSVDQELQKVTLALAARRFGEAQSLLTGLARDYPDHPRIADLEAEIHLQRETMRLQDEVNNHLEKQEHNQAMQKLSRLALMHPEDPLIRKLYDEVAQEKVREADHKASLIELHVLQEKQDYITLKIKADQTSRDGLFSIEVVACIGACGLAPVISVNGEFHAKVTSSSIKEIIENYKNQID